MTVDLFEKVKLLEAAIEVSPSLVPGVSSKVFFCIGPSIGQSSRDGQLRT